MSIFVSFLVLGPPIAGSAIAQTKRQVIDTHTHFLPFPSDPKPVSETTVRRAIQAMDENGIVKAVDLNGGFGEALKNRITLYKRIAPGRIVVFTNMNFSRVHDPQFPKKAITDLEEAYRAGARGLKVFKSLGLVYKDANGKLIRFDDPRFDAVWTKCGELGIPTRRRPSWACILETIRKTTAMWPRRLTAVPISISTLRRAWAK